MILNFWFLAAAGVAGFTTALHLTGGGAAVLQPMLRQDYDIIAKRTMHGVWHLLSLHLFVTTVTLVLMSTSPSQELRHVGEFIVVTYVAGGLSFVGVAVSYREELGGLAAALWKIPQWILMFPVAILTWVGLL